MGRTSDGDGCAGPASTGGVTMLIRDVKVGAVYTVKLSTGRMARMRVESRQDGYRNSPSRFVLVDVDTGRRKWATAAKLRAEVQPGQ